MAARTSRHLCNSRFLSFICRNRAKIQNRAVLKGCEMPRADPLFERTMNAWARLDDRQRQRFAEAFLRAALRLERQELRAWLLRRLIEPPARRAGRSGQLRHFEDRHRASHAVGARSIGSPAQINRRSPPQRTLGNQKSKYDRISGSCVPPIRLCPSKDPSPISGEYPADCEGRSMSHQPSAGDRPSRQIATNNDSTSRVTDNNFTAAPIMLSVTRHAMQSLQD